MRLRSLIFTAALLACGSAFAHEYTLGNLRVTHPYARATAPGQPAAGVYLTIENKGQHADRLIAVSSPAATTSELHMMGMTGNVMQMREVDAIALAPSATVTMAPGGGYHLMLLGLKQPLAADQAIPLTLTFEKAGRLDTKVSIKPLTATLPPEPHADKK